MAEPLMARTARILKLSSTSTKRQKPTRLPYSCHAQLGMSGLTELPAGGGRTVRGIGSRGFHSSTLTTTQTARRAPPGSVRRGRSVMAEEGIRSVGCIVDSSNPGLWQHLERHKMRFFDDMVVGPVGRGLDDVL